MRTLVCLAWVVCGAHLHLALAQGVLRHVQVVVRHGDKVPDAIDPNTASQWAEFGVSGQLTSLGIQQMENFGKELRERYIINEPLLPERFDQNLLYMRATSLGTARTLVSGEALNSAMYPDGMVPIFTVDASRETLLRPDQQCPSYVVEFPAIKERVGAQFVAQRPELIGNLSALTGYGPLSPFDLIWNVREKIEAEEHHGFSLDPYFIANEELVNGLGEIAGFELYRGTGPDDSRGPIGGELARAIRQNFMDSIEGTSNLRMHIYSAHGGTLQTLWVQLGLGSSPEIIGAALVLELREVSGDLFIVGRFFTLGEDNLSYSSQVQPLNCPSPSQACRAENFLDYIRDTNGDDFSGCCVVTQGFNDIGCNDFLNPAVLNIPECLTFRRNCPATACGQNQVLDKSTLLCTQVV